MKKHIYEAYDIDWDTDGERVEIPTTVRIDLTEEIEEAEQEQWDIEETITHEMRNKISDETGWLHNGFSIREVGVQK